MVDKYKELFDNLTIIINLLKEFESSGNDYRKPDIRAYQVKASSIAKIINSKVKDDMQKLNDDIDEYLSNPEKSKYLKLIDNAIILQNDLWEL